MQLQTQGFKAIFGKSGKQMISFFVIYLKILYYCELPLMIGLLPDVLNNRQRYSNGMHAIVVAAIVELTSTQVSSALVEVPTQLAITLYSINWNCCIDACNACCVNVWEQVSLQISVSSVLPMRPTASIYVVPIVVTSTIHRPNLWELPAQCVRRYLPSCWCCQCGLQPPFALWTTSDSDFTM